MRLFTSLALVFLVSAMQAQMRLFTSLALVFLVSAMQAQSPTLAAELTAKQNAWAEQADEDTKRAYAQGIVEVGESEAMATALQAGDRMPSFELTHANGQTVSSEALLAQGPIILTWYRGGWCPYCNLALRAYQQLLPEYQEAGAQFVALTPEVPDSSMSTQEKNELAFYVLSDVKLEVAKQFHVAYTLPEVVQEQFQGRLDIPAYNGNETWELPLAVSYVIDQEGIIRYAYLTDDYRKRAEPAELLVQVKALQLRRASGH